MLQPVGGYIELEKRVGCEREGLIQSVKKSKILFFIGGSITMGRL